MNLSSTSSSTENNIPHLNAVTFRRTLLLTIVLTVIFSSLYYYQIKNQQENHRSQTLAKDEQVLGLLNKQSASQMKLLQKFIKSLNQVDVLHTDSDKLTNKVDKHWPQLQKNNHLNYLAFYNLKGQLLAEWSQHNSSKIKHQQFNEWISKARKTGKELSTIGCHQQCNQYLTFPLFQNNLPAAYLIIGLSMQDTLNYFNDKSSRVSAILSSTINPETSTDILVYKWGYSTNGSSLSKTNRTIIDSFAKSSPAITSKRQSYHYAFNQLQYEINFYPLNLSDKSLLMVLDDISPQIINLQEKTLKFSLIVFFILSFLLTLLLSIKRFSKIPQPVLNEPVSIDKSDQENIESAKLELHEPALEINNLVISSENNSKLTRQLNLLKHYNEDINLELAHQMINVSRERDLVSNLLDNSPAIIMQLDADGTIISINSFGEEITGYSTQELSGKNFIDLYPDDAPFALKDLDSLSSLKTGKQQCYQHEAHLKTKDGQQCIILWSHTKALIETGQTNHIHLLSTGLDITHLKKLEKNMSWLLNHDSLTSLFNRRRLEKELDSAVNWAKKHQADGCLLTIDLDNFKDINDCCGHEVGDIILRKVAMTLKQLTAEIDSFSHAITARLGGDEFAIILRDMNEESASIISQRIIKALNNISHFQRHVSFQLSSCIGIATFSVADNNSTELLSNANYARNKAKLDGRNQYYVFKAEHSHLKQTHHRMIWRDRIENALKNDLFILYFQPILSIQQNKISHYETLIRMLDENNNIIAPGLFIHIAEQFGLIQQIDSFMIASAIAKQGELIKQGHEITLTINLSGKAFDDPELFNKISLAIQLNDANPENLVFEITETGAVSNIVKAKKLMMKIQTLGCKFALDDFGIGFSSFNYLRKLPFDLVKIDGTFITDLENNSDNKVLVHALSEVAIGFNKLTVAEFVDSRQTLNLLKQAKINYAQGYFIGKPSQNIPVEAPDFFLSSNNSSTSIH